jgi:hypothetical protein
MGDPGLPVPQGSAELENLQLMAHDGVFGTLWVPNRSSASCDLGILVDQPTEAVTALDT